MPLNTVKLKNQHQNQLCKLINADNLDELINLLHNEEKVI
jgi:hypothetical protein